MPGFRHQLELFSGLESDSSFVRTLFSCLTVLFEELGSNLYLSPSSASVLSYFISDLFQLSSLSLIITIFSSSSPPPFTSFTPRGASSLWASIHQPCHRPLQARSAKTAWDSAHFPALIISSCRAPSLEVRPPPPSSSSSTSSSHTFIFLTPICDCSYDSPFSHMSMCESMIHIPQDGVLTGLLHAPGIPWQLSSFGTFMTETVGLYEFDSQISVVGQNLLSAQ